MKQIETLAEEIVKIYKEEVKNFVATEEIVSEDDNGMKVNLSINFDYLKPNHE